MSDASGGQDRLDLVDLACERQGGAAIAANDEFFAPKENLLRAGEPEWREHEYTDRGKWMDGWETRRRRTPGNDWCLVRLGLPGIVREVVADTSYFRGNYPESCALWGAAVEPEPDPAGLLAPSVEWVPLVARSPLSGHAKNRFAVECPWRVTHLRLEIFPDGGVARLRVLGEPLPDWRRIARTGAEVDLASIEHGARVVAVSDRFFSAPQNMLRPGRPAGMHDGWETKRRRGPGHDWAVVRLGARGTIRRVLIDTSYFRGNYPDRASLEACAINGDAAADALPPDDAWRTVVPETKLRAHAAHGFDVAPSDDTSGGGGSVTHARLRIFPDGGVARLRVLGTVGGDELVRQGVHRLNALFPAAARRELETCCGSSRWAEAMSAARPFASLEAIHDACDRACRALGREDWLMAFAAHPKIGERKAARSQSATEASWSASEQSGMDAATADAAAGLADGNRAYEEKFGHIFIICATGRSAGEMLASLRARLANDPARELEVAAEEQRKIARLRLAKLVQP